MVDEFGKIKNIKENVWVLKNKKENKTKLFTFRSKPFYFYNQLVEPIDIYNLGGFKYVENNDWEIKQNYKKQPMFEISKWILFLSKTYNKNLKEIVNQKNFLDALYKTKFNTKTYNKLKS